jgi:hypothetical protein
MFEKRGELKSWSEEPEREKIPPLKNPLLPNGSFFTFSLLLDN